MAAKGRTFSLPAHRPLGTLDVETVQIQEPIPRQLAQPGVERNRPALDVLREPPGGLGHRVLDDVRRIDASRDAVIQPDGDHFAQATAMASQQVVDGHPVTGCGSVQMTIGARVRLGNHDCVSLRTSRPVMLPPTRGRR
jgi:hypothetical protein